jgi:hypothetical protein
MLKLLMLLSLIVVLLSACEKQQAASREVGAVPKQIVDKAKNDTQKALDLANQQLKDAEANTQ